MILAASLAAIALTASSPMALGTATTAHSAERFSLTISPAKMAADPGSTAQVTVWDTGTTRIAVGMKLAEIKRVAGVCREVPGQPGWARAHPAAFALAPGSHKVVRVRIRRQGKPGPHDLAIAASTILGHRGNVSLAGGVAVQALTRFPGHYEAKHHPKPCLTLSKPPAAAPFPFWALEYGAVLLAILAILGWLYRRHAGGHPERDAPPRSPAGPGTDTSRMP